MNKSRPRRMAIVHDWLTDPGGAEQVLRQMLIAYPEADLYTVCDFLPEKYRGLLRGRKPVTTFIQKLPFAKKLYRSYLPLMPIAIEQLDLSEYDVILSSSYCVAKGVLTGPQQVHVCYIHTPVRYAWHLQHQYLGQMKSPRLMKWVSRIFLHYIRMWDLRSAVSVDVYAANSAYIARQVHQLYRREATVLHPPVDLSRFSVETEKEDYYVTVSRLVPYKRIDLIVKAFARMPHRRLVVIGTGPELEKITELARGHSNIELMGYLPDTAVNHYLAKAKAFLFAAIEDFGIAPLEAQACGTPVIALGKAGALETVRPIGVEEPTGVFFDQQDENAVIAAVTEFERTGSLATPANCRKNAERFANEVVREKLTELVESAVTVLDSTDCGAGSLRQDISAHSYV
jgi:glycosyltransferase involved in cell wall biosynthesis